MKKNEFLYPLFWLALLFFVFADFKAISQIAIHSSDMPQIGDTLRVSMTAFIPQGYQQAGMDTTWDFSSLEAQSQRVDSFVNVNETPMAYYIYFGLLGGANLASPISAIPGLPLMDGFNFYKNESSSYNDMGLAYRTVDVPIIPLKYDNPDKYYQFPMTPGLTWSSTAGFSISLPGVGYLSRQKIRNSEVDGWGMLTTPFGTFPTLRVKSTVVEHDSIYIDSLGMGFPINRNFTEYKWLGNDQGIPLLQITEEGFLVSATYRDIYRMPVVPLSVTLGPDTTVMHGNTITLTAHVTGGVQPYQYLWNTMDTVKSITVTVEDTKTYTVFVIDSQPNFGFARQTIFVDFPSDIPDCREKLLSVYPNPTEGNVTVTITSDNGPLFLDVFNSTGTRIKQIQLLNTPSPQTVNLSGLPDGIYLLQVRSNNNTYSSKLIIQH